MEKLINYSKVFKRCQTYFFNLPSMGLKLWRQPCVCRLWVRSGLGSTKAMASIEALPLMIMFVVLVAFGLGFFGVVHTGIVYSIHARTYAFETLRNRAHYNFMRDTAPNVAARYVGPSESWVFFQSTGYRLHSIKSLQKPSSNLQVTATGRDIKFPPGSLEKHNAKKTKVHNREVLKLSTRNRNTPVNPVWLMVQYGLCLNAKCEGKKLKN